MHEAHVDEPSLPPPEDMRRHAWTAAALAVRAACSNGASPPGPSGAHDRVFTSSPPAAAAAVMEAGRSKGRVGRDVAAAQEALVQALAAPAHVACWLLAARAHDVVLLQERELGGSSSTGAAGADPVGGSGEGAGGGAQDGGGVLRQVVVATAVSDRHAAACAEAVRWQVRSPFGGKTRLWVCSAR